MLAGESYPPQSGSSRPAKLTGLEPAKEDISVAIAKLDYGIEDVSKQIKNVVRLRFLRPMSFVVMRPFRSPRTTRIYWSRQRGWEKLVGLCREFEKGSMHSMHLWKSASTHFSLGPIAVLIPG